MSYDQHDSHRHSTSRRHDSFTRPREYLSPLSTYDDTKIGSRKADHRYYNDRPRSPHSAPSSDDQRSRESPRSPRRTRITWPPVAFVESEARSLAREGEAGMKKLRESQESELPKVRGTVDQDPILQEVQQDSNQTERRFVMLSDSDSGRSGKHTPPTSEDERQKKSRPHPSKIRTDFGDRIGQMSSAQSSSTRRQQDTYQPPRVPSQSSRSQMPGQRSPQASPVSRGGSDYFAVDTSRRPVSRDGAATARLGPAPRDTRRMTDTSATMPAARLDNSSRPSPLVLASAIGAASVVARDHSLTTPRSASLAPRTFSREASLESRNASPASQRSSSPVTRSPRFSQDMTEQSSPDSRRASAVSSRAGSRNNSPPRFGSIAMPQIPSTDDWNDLVADASRRSGAPTRPSRLSESMRADSLPTIPQARSALPYPVNEGPGSPSFYMPNDQPQQWMPSISDASTLLPERPARQTRHSFTNATPTESRPIPKTEPVRSMTANAITQQEADAMLKKGLSNCSRAEPVANYDDWYAMPGAPSLDFCPNCIESVFERTVYRKYFRLAPPRDLSTKISCAFGNPWIRLAYLLSVQQRLPDLQLFKDLAEINATSDPCPRHETAVRTWYGLRDNQGLFVRDFQVCYEDVRKLERLLPTFNGFFQRLPGRGIYEEKRCSLRAETNRYTQYINTILELHDQARTKRQPPDPMPFVRLIERKSLIDECERDSLLRNSTWHYIPSVPAFTVCQDCFQDIVEPEMLKGVEIAKRFNRAAQPAHNETIGTSCQLYSPRMRKVFLRAIQDNDLKYLTRKANQRRDAEMRLQDKHTTVVRRLQRYQSRGDVDDEESRRRLARELRHIAAEWKEDWE